MSSQTTQIEARLIENLKQVCRLCLGEEYLEDIFKQEDLNMWILDSLSIVVSKDDKISRSICASCHSRLHEFREYQLHCLKVQDILLGKSTVVEEEDLSVMEAKETMESPQEGPKQTTDAQEEKHPTEDLKEKPLPVIKKRFRCHKRIEVDESGRKKYIHERSSDTKHIYRATYMKCTICNKKILEARLEGHMNWHEDFRPFTCEHGCENVAFHCQLERHQHYRKVHDRYECDICHKIYRSRKTLSAHKLSVHVPKSFGCSDCSRLFTTASRLKYHKTYAHIRERNHPCPKCNKLFGFKFEVRRHLQWHEKAEEKMRANMAFIMKDLVKTEPVADFDHDVLQGDSSTAMEEDLFEAEEVKIEPESDSEQSSDVKSWVQLETVSCSKCGNKIREADMEAHRNCPLGLSSYKCELGCENAYFRSGQVRLAHYEKVHESNECDICHKTYRYKRTLKSHKHSAHGTNNFSIPTAEKVQCSKCTKKISETGMEGHQNWHLGIWPYTCERGCENLKFRSAQLRLAHYEKVHERNVCLICNKTYRYRRALISHKQSVHGTNCFPCDCGRSFPKKSCLRRHIQEVHSSEKDQFCPICSKAFIRKSDVIKHMRLHTNCKQTVELKDLFEAEEVKIEAREDSEQTVDIKEEPTDAATCSSQHTIEVFKDT